MTRKGSLIPKVFFGSAGQVMKFVDTFVPMISSTEDWMSWSVNLLICPLRISLSQICSGLLLSQTSTYPIEYSIDRNPDWYVFLNIFVKLTIDFD